MAEQEKSQIKTWFKTNCYPTESQFADTWDSFWHKAEQIALSSIAGLTDILNSKQDKATNTVVDASTLEVYSPTQVEGYLAGNVFVSYQNLASIDADPDFKELFIYHCVIDAMMGESPETNPEKWERIGKTMTYTSSSTATGVVGTMAQLWALTGMKEGHTVAVIASNRIYIYRALQFTWQSYTEFRPVVVQTTGTSTTAVMSQKAVTDAIAAASGGGSGLASTWEANIAAIRALSSHNAGNDVGDYATLNIYEYDALSTAVDDGDIYLKPNDVSGDGRWVKKKQLALKSEVPVFKEYQISTIGATTGLLSISQLEKIVAIPSKYNIDSMKLTPVSGGADIILINTGGVIASLPINLAAITYLVTIVYASGASNSSTILQTQKQ